MIQGRPYQQLARILAAREEDVGTVTGFPMARAVQLVALADDLRAAVPPPDTVPESFQAFAVPAAAANFSALRIANPAGLWLHALYSDATTGVTHLLVQDLPALAVVTSSTTPTSLRSAPFRATVQVGQAVTIPGNTPLMARTLGGTTFTTFPGGPLWLPPGRAFGVVNAAGVGAFSIALRITEQPS